MSISDLIVVMRDGVVNQIGKPQEVYDDPANLFVAKFLGTPPINVFDGTVKSEKLYIGGAEVLSVPGAPDGDVYVGIRPEGFIRDNKGGLKCKLERVEVMGRDISIVSTHESSQNANVRSIIDADERPDDGADEVFFSLKPTKVHLFDKNTEMRVRFETK